MSQGFEDKLFAGDRITVDELAVHLDAAAVWLRRLALAAETPAYPIELKEVIEQLTGTADQLADRARTLAEVDDIVTSGRPLRRFFGLDEPWGAAALADTSGEAGRRHNRQRGPSVVLTHWQIKHLARPLDPGWGDERDVPTIPYLEGIAAVPGIESWESAHAARRRAVERERAINAEALATACERCGVDGGQQCRTANGRTADMFHRVRVRAATVVVDGGEPA